MQDCSAEKGRPPLAPEATPGQLTSPSNTLRRNALALVHEGKAEEEAGALSFLLAFAVCNKVYRVHQTKKFVVSQFWEPEFRDQRVGKVGSF